VLAPEIVPALFGEQWNVSLPVMRILAFHGIIHSLQHNGAVILALRKPARALAESVVNALITVGGILIAARWGIAGSAGVAALRGDLLYPFTAALLHPLIQVRPGELYAGYGVAGLGASAWPSLRWRPRRSLVITRVAT
jgi:PST family polysaccharide transporter